ncbi:hypothetical protein CTEN210_18112 [Chaetoceros tenuissimus]|uniref:Leucine-rich repeat domain-containing protein n=1 Tax=Chaetoceros tenuissimus TaxID=426638 RepID=A0AAD3HFR0_9STRA|nr:hypothetical protein CTEN210_18112 [Chaetoceros tenuissimus]
MRVQTEEWQRFIPGVRMYKGKMTLFYNGEILWDHENYEFLIYDRKERQSWQVIIILPGVEVIPRCTFIECRNVKTVIMANNVRRIDAGAFYKCKNLAFVKLSRNLEYVGEEAFMNCTSLTSIFIPNSCREIADSAFKCCDKLIILHVPEHTRLGDGVFYKAALADKSSRIYDIIEENEHMNAWVKSINDNDEYGLHRLCSSMDPSEDEIYELMCEHGGPCAMAKKNSIGVTPSEYLAANPYADVDEKKLMKRFVLEKMGEIV